MYQNSVQFMFRGGRYLFLIYLCILVNAPGPASAKSEYKCEYTLFQAVGSRQIKSLQHDILEADRKFRPRIEAVPAALARTASETLPALRKADLLNPVRQKPRIYVDSYHGQEYNARSSDIHIMPGDYRALCLLLPGRAVFLSDGETHHYSLIYNVDYAARRVVVLDPWASQSFLLEGRNSLGIKARAYTGLKGQSFVSVSFADFLEVWRGSVESFNPHLIFAGIEAYYPELAKSEDYLFWKYSRTFGTDSFQMSIVPVMMFTAQYGTDKTPKLKLLGQWANDYIISVLSGFSLERPGYPPTRDAPVLRKEFLERLPEYAKLLPWNLKWLLFTRTNELVDTDLRLSIIDVFLKHDPEDIDFQLARAETLIRQKRYRAAEEQLDSAREQWKAYLLRTIALPSYEDALKFFLKSDYRLQSLAVMHWRNVKIELLKFQVALYSSDDRKNDYAIFIDSLQNNYAIGSVVIDFFADVMKLSHLAGSPMEEAFIRTAIEAPYDAERVNSLGFALYRHFTVIRDISGLSEHTVSAIGSSKIGQEICASSRQGNLLFGRKENLSISLENFCKAKKSLLSTKYNPTNENTIALRTMIKAASITEREHRYCGSYFAFFADREH